MSLRSGRECQQVRRRLSALLDHELHVDQAAETRSHLADCMPCRLEFGAWLRAERALKQLAPEAGPANEAFFQGLETEILERVRSQGAQRPRRWQLVSAMAAAVLLFALGLRFGLQSPGEELLNSPRLTGTTPSAGANARTEPVSLDAPPRGLRQRASVLEVPREWVRGSAIRHMGSQAFARFARRFTEARRRLLMTAAPDCAQDFGELEFRAFAERFLRSESQARRK